MNRLLVFSILAMLSCNLTDEVKPFIPGSYCRNITNEFSNGADTLIVFALNRSTYCIIKNSSFSRIRNGKILPEQRQTEMWTAVYDKEAKVLHELKGGKVITFLPEARTLMVTGSEFKKIEN